MEEAEAKPAFVVERWTGWEWLNFGTGTCRIDTDDPVTGEA